MGIDPVQLIAGGIAGAMVNDAYEKTKEKGKEVAQGGELPDHGPIEMQMIVDILSRLEMDWREAKNNNCPPLFRVVRINGTGFTPYEIKRGGYKHMSILSSAAFTLSVQTEIGEIDFAINNGWNAFDMPNNALVNIKTGTAPSSFIIFYGDDALDIPGV